MQNLCTKSEAETVQVWAGYAGTFPHDGSSHTSGRCASHGQAPIAAGQIDASWEGQGWQFLSIQNTSLSGTLPPQLARFQNLQTLRLASNLLEGPIPTGEQQPAPVLNTPARLQVTALFGTSCPKASISMVLAH